MRKAALETSLAWTGWGLLTLAAVVVGLVSLRYLSFSPLVMDEAIRPNLINHPIPFYLHVILAPPALLIGAWQFLPLTRRSKFHRYAGRIYVACCLTSAVAGFIVAFTTEAGPVAGAGFAILAVLWFGTTLRAFLAVRGRRLAEHRRWMIRSYALTAAAITLRAILGVGLAAGMAFNDVYLIAAWACWMINLAVAETIIRRESASAAAVQLPSMLGQGTAH